VQHLTRLVDDLLDITRIARGKITLERESIELAAFVRAVIADHLPRFDERQVDLQVEVRSNPVWIQGDRTRLAQIVGNLLTNAAKFTAAGGQTRVVVCANPQNAAAYIQVQDTGRGIEPEFLSQVFEPFCQGKPTADQKQGGLGLGLSVVQGLVELHGGSVEVASAGAGRGTTFTVSLPLASKAPETTAANHGLARTGDKTRVLVVEDHVDAAEMMQEVLEAIGYEAEIALTGPAGLARARESVPDVMICDIGLPGLDGYEVARQIRAQQELAHIRLIALSGYAGPEDLARSAAAGFDVHLAKPASLEELEHAIASSP
jgi:CheY-like chemotaxis protein/two-component sensor histidine kinase